MVKSLQRKFAVMAAKILDQKDDACEWDGIRFEKQAAVVLVGSCATK